MRNERGYTDGYIESATGIHIKKRRTYGMVLCIVLALTIIASSLTLFLRQVDYTELNAYPEQEIEHSMRPNLEFMAPDTRGLDGAVIRVVPAPIDGVPLSYGEVYEKAILSVTSIYSSSADRLINQGTGIVITDDGLILTCAHLLDGADRIDVVVYGGVAYRAAVAASDIVSDLILLRINANDLTPAEFGSGADIGDSLLLLGNPVNQSILLTDGILSGINEAAIVNG